MSVNISATGGGRPRTALGEILVLPLQAERGLAKMSKHKKTGVEIWDLDGNGTRFALVIGGVIQFVGSHDDCKRRASILDRSGERDYQDKMLRRALRQ
jgi:hypothetical protein